jgi:hypothetical protein
MPWQQHVADVGLELDADGLPAYREVVVTIPRQNGKTTLVVSWVLDRALMWGSRQRAVYTAQTGKDARDKVLDDWVPLIDGSPLKAAIGKVKRVNGSEGIMFKGGGQLDVLASSESSGHGRTLDLGVIDEAFDDVDHRREQAIIPAMSTKRSAQLLVVSTMGTDRSLYLNQKVDAGRAAVTSGATSGIAYFEWSAPEDADIDDPATWYGCMPALGRTIDESVIRHARQTMPEGEFRRAYLNQRTQSDERVIPAAVWDAVCGPDVMPDGRVVFAVDSPPDRSAASIAVADADRKVELVEYERGTGWAVPRCEELARKWGTAIAVDPSGPAGAFGVELKQRGVRVIEVAGRDMANACGQFYDAVADQTVRIRTHDVLNAAVGAAMKRPTGDTWVWGRKNLTDISPLVAVTLASYAASVAPGTPKYWSSDELWSDT